MLIRRVTQKFFVIISGLLFTYFCCEYLIYYVVVAQCYWPTTEKLNGQYLKAFILADTHLLGPYRGHWLDKWRREFQMQQAFQAIITIHKPDVVFILGDLFDEGEWTNEQQFRDYVDRFHKLFRLPDDINMHVVAGNHDIGFHNNIRRHSAKRFVELFQAPSVQHVTLKGSQFILINSMALHGDSCELCLDARSSINRISDVIHCTENVEECNQEVNLNYSRPIIMQHFPLYRVSDAVCTEPDAPPLPERNKKFRLKIDALSRESTKYLIEKLKPRAVFGGHTHHGCKLLHSYKNLNVEFWEYSVPSFSWRNRLDPKFMLVSISPETYMINKCGLPSEQTIILTAIIMIFGLIFFLSTKRTIGRRYQ